MPYSHLADYPANIRERAARIRLACFDVDGTLTDGRLYFDSNGLELKAFHVHDGQGLVLLRKAGMDQVAFMGDDLPDLRAQAAVGLAVAPGDAHHWVRERVHWRTVSRGGHGAARELCDLLLGAQGHAEAALAGTL